MQGFVDLHSHWLPAIDDGCRTLEEGLELLRKLRELGFDRVVATPHMRPGMFDNEREGLRAAFSAAVAVANATPGVPTTLELASEHYFDDVVYERVLRGEALPYPGGRAVLLEFYEIDFPPQIDRALSKLVRANLRPVIAHPERYRAIRRDPAVLDRLLDLGAVALLDLAALVGKYGAEPKKTAEQLLEAGSYHAACSDAHRPDDAAEVGAAIEWLRENYGADEVQQLLRIGPEEIIAGRVPE